ncbi:MAG TPA: M48 family metalloprotease [Rhodanobacteraceae bacterium]|jgi:predicted Zn-dependent protease|nr:M48 family metalloprotease [Rhodanobacteraceae bacterium]
MAITSRFRLLSTFAATLLLTLPAAAQQADVKLPNLGSAADTVMTPQQASAYGAQFLHELRGAHLVLDDPQVDQYLHTLGYRLASSSADPTQHYTFTLLNIPEINAFATFGGYVFIFARMFTITHSQDELAAVMAHELAHISQHHLQRSLEDQKKSTPLYVLGAFAAALAASKVDSGTGSNQRPIYGNGYGYGSYGAGGDAAMGAFISVMALMQQHQIEFTRKDESEADHVGIDTLARAGFKPEAMADVFARMQSLLRPGGDGGMAAGNLPGFLQDHPVTSVRIADARARARVLDKQPSAFRSSYAAPPPGGLLPLPFGASGANPLAISRSSPSELQYELMRERVRVLTSSNPRATLEYYTHSMAASHDFAAATANRYGYALALVQLGQAAKAVPVLAELADAAPDNLTLSLGLADAERHAGQRAQALQRYARLNDRWPDDPAVVLDYSRTLLDDGSKASARIAQAMLKPLLDDNSEPSLYEAYGHACHVAGDEVHAGIAYADATYLSGNAVAALDQLSRLLKRTDLDYYTRAQINARIAQITPIVLEIRRRHLDRDDDGNSFTGTRAQTGLSLCAGAACSRP